MLSNCGKDEYGRYSYGTAGDQTGAEWNIVPWYNYGDGGWNWVLRHPNAEVRKWINTLAKEAAQNDMIGYDQAERYTFWDRLREVNYRPKDIRTPCETDCSAGVLAICKAVGYIVGDTALQNISQYGYTGNERQILTAAGFTATNERSFLTSESNLISGDILLNTVNHTCICVDSSNKEEEDDCYYFHTNEIGPGATGVDVWRLQMILKARGYYTGSVDKLYGNQTKAAVKAFQTKAGLKASGTCDRATWHTLLGLSFDNGRYCFVPCCEGYTGSTSVLLVQEMLKASGYYTGKLDWNFKSDLRSAVMKWQKATKKLKVNGCVNKEDIHWMIG